jgi:hypothetical protein
VTANNTTTPAITGLGGYYRLNGATVVAGEHTQYIVCSYQNPLMPEAAGVALDARNLVITDILISPMVVTTVLVGGGAVWGWFIAVGHNAISLSTADAAGTTALGTVSPRVLPLPIYDQIGAAAAVGTVATRTGQSAISLETPLVVPTGCFVAVGIRSKHVAAAITSGVLDGQIGISGYWD